MIAAAPAAMQADDEMAGEVQPLDQPAQAARRMDIENGERDRQAAPPLDHLRQVGVAQIVVILFVAL